MGHFLKGKLIAFDCESTGLNSWHGDRPFAFSFCNEDMKTAHFEFEVDPYTRKPIYTAPEMRAIKRILEDDTVVKVGHNVKFDVRMAEAIDITVCGPGGPVSSGGEQHETMFMAHACNSLEPNYRLKTLGWKYAEIDDSDQKELQQATAKLRRMAKKLGWNIAVERHEKIDGTIKTKSVVVADYWIPYTMSKRMPGTVSEAILNACKRYGTLDAVRTMVLAAFYRGLMKELKVEATYRREMKLWPIIYAAETRGVRIDPDGLEQEIKECIVRRQRILPKIMKKAWSGFNMDSNDDMRILLYDKLKIPVNPERVTAKLGLPSVDTDVMNDNRLNKTCQRILRYRGAGKAFGYFTQYRRLMIPDPLNAKGYVLHPEIRQVGPATGRLACANPNVMQVTSIESSRSAEPIDARTSFGPRPGYAWLHNDYKGMEINVFAFVSQEQNMLRAIAEGREIHDEVGNRGWGGKDNPAGIRECVHVLGLDGSELGKDSEEIEKLWKEWGIRDVRKLYNRDREKLASEFLERYDWKIVEAQAAIHRKVTKNKGKMVSFAKIYGGGPNAVKDLLHVSYDEARQFMDEYDVAFPRIPEYMEECTQRGRSEGFVRTLWNRRLTIDRDKAYRYVNYLVQGSSADLLKSAMRRCHKFITKEGVDAHLLMPIHDELVFEVRKDDLTRGFIKSICNVMQDSEGRIGIPMPTEPSIAWHSWNVKKKIKL